MTCCFFGHKDTPSTAAHLIEETINKLISEQGVTSFLVGNQGQFDAMALSVLRNMKIKHPSIMYNVVLAYMPSVGSAEWNPYEYGETMLPEGIEVVHPRYAISWRNKWMVNESDIVVCYINRSWGGAAKYVEMATKKAKRLSIWPNNKTAPCSFNEVHDAVFYFPILLVMNVHLTSAIYPK